jgi:hypothetical protein
MRRINMLLAAVTVITLSLSAEQMNEKVLKDNNHAPNRAGLADIYGKSIQAPSQAQAVGDVAVGVIVIDDGSNLYLDGDPCHKKIYHFQAPYIRSATGNIVMCGNTKLPEYRVRQKEIELSPAASQNQKEPH